MHACVRMRTHMQPSQAVHRTWHKAFLGQLDPLSRGPSQDIMPPGPLNVRHHAHRTQPKAEASTHSTTSG